MLLLSFRPLLLRALVSFVALVVLATPGCKRGSVVSKHEYMYVSAPETSLRDRVATMYNKTGTIHNGERVEVIDRARRFVRVRTSQGAEGWVEQRSLVTEDVYDASQKLAKDNASIAIQGHGTTRADLNMHIVPARYGEHLYQLKEGEKVEILQRATTDRNAKPPAPPKPAANPSAKPAEQKSGEQKDAAATPQPAPPTQNQAAASANSSDDTKADAKPEPEAPMPVMEDWYLVRNSAGQVGWVLMRMVDLDVPLDVAQYAEGQRIVGYFVLNTVTETIEDQPKDIPQYLVLLNEPKNGLPYDFNQIRVFTRNRNKHRYETAYRERDIEGYLPAYVSHANFDKEGELPTFTVRKKNAEGQIVDVTYKMNGPIVRRVLSPEEIAEQKAKHDAELSARQQARAQLKAQKAAKKSSAKKKHH